MKQNRILHASLESQLSLLKRRMGHPDASQWRQLGKMTQDFGLWLERARPLIPCAARLISLRVGQISEQLLPEANLEKASRQLLELLNEAGRHLADPRSPIQVIDLERQERSVSTGFEEAAQDGLVGLPTEMYELPPWLQPNEDPAAPFRFIIPN